MCQRLLITRKFSINPILEFLKLDLVSLNRSPLPWLVKPLFTVVNSFSSHQPWNECFISGVKFRSDALEKIACLIIEKLSLFSVVAIQTAHSIDASLEELYQSVEDLCNHGMAERVLILYWLSRNLRKQLFNQCFKSIGFLSWKKQCRRIFRKILNCQDSE